MDTMVTSVRGVFAVDKNFTKACVAFDDILIAIFFAIFAFNSSVAACTFKIESFYLVLLITTEMREMQNHELFRYLHSSVLLENQEDFITIKNLDLELCAKKSSLDILTSVFFYKLSL